MELVHSEDIHDEENLYAFVSIIIIYQNVLFL